MNKNLSRITIDVPVETHKALKRKAIDVDKSIREIILEFLEDYLGEETSKEQ